MDYSIGRREFVGAAIADAALSFANSELALAEEELVRIMPASPLAQSALLIFAPEMASSLVYEPESEEIPGSCERVSSLPITGRLDESNPEQFMEAALDIKPDFVLDVGMYDREHWRVLDDLEKSLSVKVVAVDASGLTVFGAIRAAGGLLGCPLPEEKMQALDEMETLMAKGIEMASQNERYTVHLGETSAATAAFLRKSPDYRMLTEACAEEWVAEDDESMFDGNGPEVIVCATKESWEGYLAKEHAQFDWSLTDAASCGCVIPGLVAGIQWIGRMSPFAKMTVGALWLGNVLYPSSFELEDGRIAELYYRILLGSTAAATVQDERIAAVVNNFRKKTHSETIAEQRLSRERKDRLAAQFVDNIRQADSRKLSDNEREVLGSFLEGRMFKVEGRMGKPVIDKCEEELQ